MLVLESGVKDGGLEDRQNEAHLSGWKSPTSQPPEALSPREGLWRREDLGQQMAQPSTLMTDIFLPEEVWGGWRENGLEVGLDSG